ncbi:MAG TPA: hypothetical protein VGK95_13340 [Caldimonas sp.]|jgi:hypothetical protein
MAGQEVAAALRLLGSRLRRRPERALRNGAVTPGWQATPFALHVDVEAR